MMRGSSLGRVAAIAALLALVVVPSGRVAAQGSDVTLTPILQGYQLPVLVTHAGSGRTIFIVEQTGTIKRATFENGQWQKLGTFLDLTDKVVDPRDGDSERGLLGLAFHPDYETNGLFYVHYTRSGGPRMRGDIVIAEFRRETAGSADPGSRRVLMRIDHSRFANHNGGNLAFGPDGMLYIGLGDGGGGGDPFRNGLDKQSRLGKILRIDPRRSGRRAFRVPSSNPFVGRRGLDVIWAYGLRNPWRFTFDRLTGDLWIGDVGQSGPRGGRSGLRERCGSERGTRQELRLESLRGPARIPSGPEPRVSRGDAARLRLRQPPCRLRLGHRRLCPSRPDRPDWRGLYVAADFCGRLFVLGQRRRRAALGGHEPLALVVRRRRCGADLRDRPRR